MSTTAAAAVEPGQKAPEFTLLAQGGKRVSLSEYLGQKNVLLAFYAMDWSPVCSLQLPLLQENLEPFAGKDTIVLGISVDHIYSHAAFARHLGIKYDLLADFHPKGEVARQFGIYREADGFSERATFLVDKAGIVHYKRIHLLKDVPEVEEILQVLQNLSP